MAIHHVRTSKKFHLLSLVVTEDTVCHRLLKNCLIAAVVRRTLNESLALACYLYG